MGYFKKILIAIIVIISILILSSLIMKRKQIYQIKQKLESSSNVLEGLSQNSSIYKSVKGEIAVVTIDEKKYPNVFQSLASDMMSYPLNNFIVKSSYNSAYSGGFISDEMVGYVLSRGCRMIDFEVFYLPIGGSYNAYIGYSPTNSTTPNVKNNMDQLPSLYSMLKNCIGFAFKNSGNYNVNNKKDPLFINIRLKVDQDKESDLLKVIIQNIKQLQKESQYGDYFYKGQEVTPNTPMKYLMEKIIIVIQNTNTLQNMIDAGEINGSLFFRINNTTNSPFELMNETMINDLNKPPSAKNTYEISKNHFRMVAPSNNGLSSNMDIYKTMQNVGANFTMMMYYYADRQLLLTEDIFTTYKGGIIPMTFGLQYITKYPVIQNTPM